MHFVTVVESSANIYYVEYCFSTGYNKNRSVLLSQYELMQTGEGDCGFAGA